MTAITQPAGSSFVSHLGKQSLGKSTRQGNGCMLLYVKYRSGLELLYRELYVNEAITSAHILSLSFHTPMRNDRGTDKTWKKEMCKKRKRVWRD